jgi:hypothetical protein
LVLLDFSRYEERCVNTSHFVLPDFQTNRDESICFLLLELPSPQILPKFSKNPGDRQKQAMNTTETRPAPRNVIARFYIPFQNKPKIRIR